MMKCNAIQNNPIRNKILRNETHRRLYFVSMDGRKESASASTFRKKLCASKLMLVVLAVVALTTVHL